ncbi:hypothetical protein EV183_005502 [Coemansia sp. RSA 2336]|nr:hypothetical protein EV183_005502 [Coemansia sp. RSA 2336]
MKLFAAISLFCVVTRASDLPHVFGYYSTWEKKATEAIGFSKYSHVIISFANPCKDGTFEVPDFDVSDAVAKISKDKAKAMVSIGGWSYSANFSSIMKDETASSAFANNIVSYVEKYKLDGVDLDWEYPGNDNGQEGNGVDKAHDTPNYLTFLQKLRKQLDAKFSSRKLITMAVGMQTFYVDGEPLQDMSEFAKVVDYANLMLYDAYGSWSKTSGPNAPLEGKGVTFESGIKTWADAKWPTSQLIAGFAFYGHSVKLSKQPKDISTSQYWPISKEVPQGDSQDQPAEGGSYTGLWQYSNLRPQLLARSLTSKPGWDRYWDSQSMTPYLFNKKSLVFISYDDQQSIWAKAKYANQQGLAGGMVWSMHMDYNNELLDVIRCWGSDSTAEIIGDEGSAVAGEMGSSSSLPTSSAPSTHTSAIASSVGTDADGADGSAVQSGSSNLLSSDGVEYCTETMPVTDTAGSSTQSALSSENADSQTSQTSTQSALSSDHADSPASQTIDSGSASSSISPAAEDSSSASTNQTIDASSADDMGEECTEGSSEYSSSASTESHSGGKCSVDGHQQCQQADGQGTAYSVCDHGRWVPMQCGVKTVCMQSGTFIQCGFSS